MTRGGVAYDAVLGCSRVPTVGGATATIIYVCSVHQGIRGTSSCTSINRQQQQPCQLLRAYVSVLVRFCSWFACALLWRGQVYIRRMLVLCLTEFEMIGLWFEAMPR